MGTITLGLVWFLGAVCLSTSTDAAFVTHEVTSRETNSHFKDRELIIANPTSFVSTAPVHPAFRTTTTLYYSESPEEALQRTASQLEKIKQQSPRGVKASSEQLDGELEASVRQFLLQSANSLKEELGRRRLPQKGRKPDLARRLAIYELQARCPDSNELVESGQQEPEAAPWDSITSAHDEEAVKIVPSFCGKKISLAAGRALGKARFFSPSPIQQASFARLTKGESLVLHAETGSGKTLAYLLPITEQLWEEYSNVDDESLGLAFILTPTRELAAQVAGVASVLAPPGSVRLVSHPTNLASSQSYLKDRGEEPNGGRVDKNDADHGLNRRSSPRLIVGSAKSIMHSLYGDGTMPASPTRKPDAMHLLRNTRWLVLDEVDRLLNVQKARGSTARNKANKHEKPAAVVTAAAARMTLGRAQVISASATVGRPLKRELTRVLGLVPNDCPDVVRGNQDDGNDIDEAVQNGQSGRAVTIPNTVENYVTSVDTSSVGKLLTSAFFVIKSLSKNKAKQGRRMLLVLTRGCGINSQTAIGALKHFRCQPEPKSLLDSLQAADGTDGLMQVHREVSRSRGLGEAYFQTPEQKSGEDSKDEDGYLLVTGEDTIRGLHLDGIDFVIVVGRPQGPDEYIHIAGRTGRAGRSGKVINVLSHENVQAIKGWEHILGVEFTHIEIENVATLE